MKTYRILELLAGALLCASAFWGCSDEPDIPEIVEPENPENPGTDDPPISEKSWFDLPKEKFLAASYS